MAERVGFEPTNELPHCWFSRPVLLTAQPPLQNVFQLDFNIFIMIFRQPAISLIFYLFSLLCLILDKLKL